MELKMEMEMEMEMEMTAKRSMISKFYGYSYYDQT